MLCRLHVQRVAANAGAAMRCRPQSHDLRPKPDRPVVFIARYVLEPDEDRHVGDDKHSRNYPFCMLLAFADVPDERSSAGRAGRRLTLPFIAKTKERHQHESEGGECRRQEDERLKVVVEGMVEQIRPNGVG
jgi:hypothetical protein